MAGPTGHAGGILQAAAIRVKSFGNHPGVRRYGSNIVWLAVEKGIRILIGLSIGVYVARQLGPAKFGLLNYAISFTAIFSVLAGMGLDVLVVRELVRRPERRDSLLGTSFLLKMTGFAVMMALVEAVLAIAGPGEGHALIRIMAAGYFFQSFQVLDCYFQARVESKYVAWTQIAALLAVSAARGYFAWAELPLEYFAAAEAGYMVLVAAGYAFFFRRGGLRIGDWRWDGGLARQLLRDAWPLLLGSGALMIYTRLDQVMVKSLLGDADNGQYAAAVRMIELGYLPILIFGNTFFPSVVGMRKTSLRRYYQRIKSFICGSFYFALLLAGPLALLGYLVLHYLYGPAYAVASQLFLWYVLRIFLLYPSMALGNWWMAENMQTLALFVNIASAVATVILNWLLLPKVGVVGAVWSNLLILLLTNFVFSLVTAKGRYGVRLLLSSLVMSPRQAYRHIFGD